MVVAVVFSFKWLSCKLVEFSRDGDVVASVVDCQVSQWYDLVVFTASMEIYGAAVAEKLDRNRGILKRRYYRQVGSNLYFFPTVRTNSLHT